MTVKLLQTLSLVAYIAAGVFLLVGIALFFLLDVPKLYGDISGRSAKKAIENIRRQNETSGNKAYKPSTVNVERGKITDRITKSGNLEIKNTASGIHVGTERLPKSESNSKSNETTLLEQPIGETTVLGDVFSDSGQTTVLASNVSNTIVQSDDEFTIDVAMSFTASSEIIE